MVFRETIEKRKLVEEKEQKHTKRKVNSEPQLDSLPINPELLALFQQQSFLGQLKSAVNNPGRLDSLEQKLNKLVEENENVKRERDILKLEYENIKRENEFLKKEMKGISQQKFRFLSGLDIKEEERKQSTKLEALNMTVQSQRDLIRESELTLRHEIEVVGREKDFSLFKMVKIV